IIRVDFGASLTNTSPTVTSIASVVSAGNLTLHEENGSWYLLVSGTVSYSAFRVNLGTDIKNNTPTVNTLASTGGVNKGMFVFTNKSCGDQVYAYGVDEAGRQHKYTFGNSVTNAATFASLGNFTTQRNIGMNTFVYGD